MNTPHTTDLTGKTAAITGGGGVLCSCMASALGAVGAQVAVLDLRQEAAATVADQIVNSGGRARGYACDVLNADNLRQVNQQIEADLGPIDILLNGAGGNHPKGTTSREFLLPDDLAKQSRELVTFYDLDADGIQFVLNLNFLGTLLPCQALTRAMAERQKGIVVNVSSMNAFTPLTKIPAYSAAKAAVSNFTQWLAVHMSKVGIRVNAIAPGFFLTEQNRLLLTQESGELTERGKTIISHTPMGKFGVAEDLLGTLLWLVDDDMSGFVTGTVIPVDGGFSAFSGV
jgi:NAD(P)-dependent dehydrogenase (short-subunit alcohol dehydrogenase family)